MPSVIPDYMHANAEQKSPIYLPGHICIYEGFLLLHIIKYIEVHVGGHGMVWTIYVGLCIASTCMCVCSWYGVD